MERLPNGEEGNSDGCGAAATLSLMDINMPGVDGITAMLPSCGHFFKITSKIQQEEADYRVA
ncbi:MAG: hypothetical protein U0401_02875 [Anaerolineae bacterium]